MAPPTRKPPAPPTLVPEEAVAAHLAAQDQQGEGMTVDELRSHLEDAAKALGQATEALGQVTDLLDQLDSEQS
jgi:hypothetical protein